MARRVLWGYLPAFRSWGAEAAADAQHTSNRPDPPTAHPPTRPFHRLAGG